MYRTMTSATGNLSDNIPPQLAEEITQAVLQRGAVRIERIISQGQTAPAEGWYDQGEHEWVIVLQGAAKLAFADGRKLDMKPGDYVHLPAHRKHRVAWTDPDQVTVWLAVFFE